MSETLKLPVSQGLRPEPELIYEPQYQNDCQNLYLNRNGVFEAEKLTRTDFGIDGFARAFLTRTETYIISLSGDKLYKWSSSNLTQLLASIQHSSKDLWWSCSDFGNYVIISNYSEILVRNPTDGTWSINNTLFPLSRATCAHRGRLILASPVTTTFGITVNDEPRNFVAWSKINELTFQNTTTTDISNLSGFMPMEYSGALIRVEPLKQHVIVYGINGISALTLAGQLGYGMTTIHPTGIISSYAVQPNGFADGTTVHYFIDKSGDLFMVDATLKVTKLGYKEIFAADYDSYGNLFMSYNIKRNELLINFLGSDKTYVYGAHGLTWINGDIIHLFERQGTRDILATSAIAQSNIVYQTNTFDMGCECQKSLWGFSARIAAPETVSVIIDYRTTRTGAWTSSSTLTFDKARGYLNVGRLAGVEFRITIKILNSYTTFQLSDIEVVYSKIGGGPLDDE